MALSEVEPPQAPLRGACGSTRLQRHVPSPSASLTSLTPSLLEHHARPVRGVVSRAYFEPSEFCTLLVLHTFEGGAYKYVNFRDKLVYNCFSI